MPLKPENAKKILAIITHRPELYNQRHWINFRGLESDDLAITPPDGVTVEDILAEDSDSAKNMCGTTFCVAGWATLLDGWTVHRMSAKTFAKKHGTEGLAEVFGDETAKRYEEYPKTLGGYPYMFYRDPNGKWVTRGNGPENPDFLVVGAEFLGLTTAHGRRLAESLFAGSASERVVKSALQALSEGEYPTALVEEEMRRLREAHNALTRAHAVSYVPGGSGHSLSKSLYEAEDAIRAQLAEYDVHNL